MADEFVLRRFESGDGPAVRALHERAMAETNGLVDDDLDDDESLDADLDAIAETYLDGRGDFVVGEADGELVAMGALRPHEREDVAELKRLRVHPDHQRWGFGQRVLDRLERRARDLGYERVALDTQARQKGAIALVEANGYERFHELTWHGRHILLYRKDL